MYKQWILLAIALISPAQATQAGQRIVGSISLGPSWYQAGQTQIVALQPTYDNTYVADTPLHLLGTAELFLGLQGQLNTHAYAQYGVMYAASTDAQLQGMIWEFGDPAFNNFNYDYNLQHRALALKGRLLTDYLSTRYLPYASASVGIGFNRTYQFNMKPLLYEIVEDSGFQSKTITSVSYTVGLGIQRVINTHWSIGMGYEFADFGRSILGPTPVQTGAQGLILNHLYTNQLQFSVHYLN